MSIDREHPNSCRLYKVWNKAVKWDSQAKKSAVGSKHSCNSTEGDDYSGHLNSIILRKY